MSAHLSATTIARAFACDYATVAQRLAAESPADPGVACDLDATAQRAVELGVQWEAEVVAAYREGTPLARALGRSLRPHTVVDCSDYDPDRLPWEELLGGTADVLYQVPIRGRGIVGVADFLVRTTAGWRLQDAKLSRTATAPAAMQLGAYWYVLSEVVAALGGTPALCDEADILTGSGRAYPVRAAEIAYTIPSRIAHVRSLADYPGTDRLALWRDDVVAGALAACGSCEWCADAIARTDDLSLIAGIRPKTRSTLREAGMRTIHDVAACTVEQLPPLGSVNATALLRRARLQSEQMRRQQALPEGAPADISWQVISTEPLRQLPVATPDDIYFDFEGDPLFYRSGREEWGLEYLWGLFFRTDAPSQVRPRRSLDALTTATSTLAAPREFRTPNELSHAAGGRYEAWWAWDEAGEREHFMRFLEELHRRRERTPDFHVYHYNNYEISALRRIASHNGILEAELEDLISAGVFVDLLPIVRHALAVSQPSYSIKKLEAAYMGDIARLEDLNNAGDSISVFAEACALRRAGNSAEADRRVANLELYNEYDVVSTMLLHHWLIEVAREADPQAQLWGPLDVGEAPVPETPDTSDGDEEAAAQATPAPGQPSPLDLARDRLAPFVGEGDDLYDNGSLTEPLQRLLALTRFYWREENAKKIDDYRKRCAPLETWEDDKDAIVLTDVRVVDDWERKGAKARRTLTAGVRGPIVTEKRKDLKCYYPGSKPGTQRFGDEERSSWSTVTITDETDGRLTLVESTKDDVGLLWDDLPVALRASQYFPTTPMQTNLAAFVERVCETISAAGTAQHGPLAAEIARQVERELSSDPRWRLLTRKLSPGAREKAASVATCPGASSLHQAFTLVSKSEVGSVLAVQGPPGTGKTFVGARVIASLAADKNWRIGIVGQSHVTVENVLAPLATMTGADLADVDLPTPHGEPRTMFAPTQMGKKPHVVDNMPVDGFPTRIREMAALLPEWKQSGPPPEYPRWTRLDAPCYWTWCANGTPAKRDRAAIVTPRDAAGSDPTFRILGGTARDPGKFGHLDLLVIDEAAQFSLADTLASAIHADRILLLGDPQQLPQVNVASHPLGMGSSALGWWMGDSSVIAAERGLFMAQTYRMVPELTARVSRLSYDNSLLAAPAARERALTPIGEAPVVSAGVHGLPVDAPSPAPTISPTEARRVREVCEQLIGHYEWAERDQARPLTGSDIIVVAPYNAQVRAIRDELGPRFADVRVGTVDKFQGQEAPIVLVSLTAHDLAEAARGAEFVLNRNRLNVAVSRAKWCAYVTYASSLASWAPTSIPGATQLGAFLRLLAPTP